MQKERKSTYVKHALCLVWLLSFSLIVFGQQPTSISADSLKTRYELATQRYLYNGYEYVHYDMHMYNNADPYYKGRDYATGDVWYVGRHFHHISMVYDIVRDVVITPNNYIPGTYGQMVLQHDRVDSFTVHDQLFVLLRDSSQLRPGYYAKLYPGAHFTLYARYIKRLEKGKLIPEGGVWDVITPFTYYEIEEQGKFHTVRTIKELGILLHQKKSTIRRYLRQNNLDIKEAREEALLQTVRHFDHQ